MLKTHLGNTIRQVSSIRVTILLGPLRPALGVNMVDLVESLPHFLTLRCDQGSVFSVALILKDAVDV